MRSSMRSSHFLLSFVLACAACLVSSVASTCSYTPYPNYDLNGGDLPNQPAGTNLSNLQECASLCCAAGYPCTAFALNAGAAGSRLCYLKYAGGWTNTSIAGVDSGVLAPPPPAPVFPWFNASLPRSARVAALVSAMTLAEQVSWLNDAAPAIPRLGLPAYSWEAEALHGVAWNGVATVFPAPIAWGAAWDVPLAAAIADVIATEARAKWVDGLGPDGSSVQLAGLSFMTPNSNLFVDPRWGRGQETYGEEPVLTSALVYAVITALQFGEDATYNRVIATSKHWLGYHLESWDGDAQYRLSHSFNYSDTDIQQYYILPFAAAVAANVSAVMCAYDGANGTNPQWPRPSGREPWGVPMCLHPDMQRLLRGQLGFGGYVISDEGSITFAGPGYHGYTTTVQEAACLAMNAGTDLALGSEYASTLGQCVAQGNVSTARIAQALTRLMTAHMQLGWFDTLAARKAGLPDPVTYNNVSVAADVSTPQHRLLARHAAQQGLVLLKNLYSSALPLNPAAISKLALVGPAANYTPQTATSSYLGNYSPCEQGAGGDLVADPRCRVVTVLQALEEESAASGFSLSYAPGCDVNTPNATQGFQAALAAAAGADVIVAAVGLNTCQETACSEGEANDRLSTLDLPGSQLQLLQALAAAYPTTPLVLVLLNGGPLSSPWAFGHAAAVLEAWYPGYEGGAAVAAALFGAYSPAGRLPVTVLRSMGDLPLYTDFNLASPPGRTHRYYSGPNTLYPFGFGLSYANFTYSSLSVSPPVLAAKDEAFVVKAVVTHAGGPVSDEVVQVYGSFHAASTGAASVPLQQLLAFTRLYNVSAGSPPTPVSFRLPRSALQLVAPDGRVLVSAGVWAITVGGGPPDYAKYPGGGAVLTGTLTVAAVEEPGAA